MIQKTMLLLISFVLLTGCSIKNTEQMETLNGMHSDFWVNQEYKDVIKQWQGYSINDMLTHSDFSDCTYHKSSVSPHIDIYIIQLSVWRYAVQGITLTNEFVIHAFTNKEFQILSFAFPQTMKRQSIQQPKVFAETPK